MQKDLPAVVLTIVIAGVILLVGVSVVSGVIDATEASADTTQTGVLLDGTDWVRIDDTTGTEQTVYDSRGRAVELSGATDSYIQSTDDITTIDEENWTISVHGATDESTTQQLTAVNIDGEVEIAYNGTRDEWTGWYYDSGSRDSYRVNVTHNAGVDEFANVVLLKNQTHLKIYGVSDRIGGPNVVEGETEALDDSAEAYYNGQNWNGRLDELRVYNTTWNETTIQNHYANPIDPIPDGVRGRVMFDEDYRTDQRFLYQPGEIVLYNATLAQGLPGSELTTASSVFQNDYEWRSDGPQIRAVSGGELQDAPIAYVDYKNLAQSNSLLESYESAIELAGIVLILIPLGIVVVKLQAMRTGR